MNLLLQRYSDDGESTLGLLFVDRRFECYTLEDERRGVKVAGETRIPAGTYPLQLRQVLSPMTERYRARYPWFTWHVEIDDVPGFDFVYLHVGNKDADTDGCILLGDTVNNNAVGDGFLGTSAVAFERWYKRVVPHLEAGGTTILEIRDEDALFDASLKPGAV